MASIDSRVERDAVFGPPSPVAAAVRDESTLPTVDHAVAGSGSRGRLRQNFPPSRFWQALRRAVRRRCPRCGDGALFAGYLRHVEQCDVCGESYGRIHADDGPAWPMIGIGSSRRPDGPLFRNASSIPAGGEHAALAAPCLVADAGRPACDESLFHRRDLGYEGSRHRLAHPFPMAAGPFSRRPNMHDAERPIIEPRKMARPLGSTMTLAFFNLLFFCGEFVPGTGAAVCVALRG